MNDLITSAPVPEDRPTGVCLPAPAQGNDSLRAVVLRKVTLRLVPFLCLLFICNILDRVNAGFARTTMQPDLGMSDGAFDLGYGLFYIGYLLFEVPSNLLLRRMGARRWISRILVSWGLVSCAMLAVRGPWSFSFARILLGVAEAGFFPGIVLYLTFWFPARERARVIALFMSAIPLAGVFGNPLSGVIVNNLHGVGGLAGWQWLFLLEGFPAMLLGLGVLLFLTDRPEQARWLTGEERAWLVQEMNQEEAHRQQRHGADFRRALTDGRVWLLICLYFTVAVGANASGAYFVRFIKDRFMGYSQSQIGLLAALPHVCAILSMTALGARSDRTGERRKHLAFAAFLAASGWALAGLSASPWLFLIGLCVAQAGMMSMLPIFWALPTAFLSGAAAAGGIALINSMGNLGGLTGPTILGRYGLWSMAGTLFLGGMLALAVRRDATLDRGLSGKRP